MRSLLALALVLGTLGAAPLITNDGSFAPSYPLGTPYSFSVTNTLTQFIAAPVSPQAIHFYAIAGYVGDSATGGPMYLETGTGTNCGTNTAIVGVMANANNTAAGASFGMSWGNGTGVVYQLPAGQAACVIGTISGTISYAYAWGTYAVY